MNLRAVLFTGGLVPGISIAIVMQALPLSRVRERVPAFLFFLVAPSTEDYPAQAEIEEPERLLDHDGVEVYIGYGSALAVDPANDRRFFLLTDRGPNVDAGEDRIAFLAPGFTPRIGHFELEGSILRKISVIELEDEEGRKLTGLPRKPGAGGTGEVPEDPDGRVLDFDERGVDLEGLVALPGGGFWVSDEYGPRLMRLSASGRILERLDAYGSTDRNLPRVLRRRRPNRGMEGLTITPDGKTLVGVMESALDNPSKAVRDTSRLVRLLFLDIASGRSRQYVYLQEKAGYSTSDIVALTDTSFLVLERDRKRPADPSDAAELSRVYRIEVGDATDVSDSEDGPGGLLVEGKTLEEVAAEDLEVSGIRPVTKTIAIDLLALPSGYPHDKPEGLAVMRNGWVAVSNDSDFGVDDDGNGRIVPKKLPGLGYAVDRTRVYFVPLDVARR